MKRKIIFLILLICILLCGCQNDISLTNTDGLYFYAAWKQGDSLIKYNTQTGTATYVCADPLCDHATSDCLFYHAQNDICIVDNCVYYVRYNDDRTQYYFMQYDVSASSAKVLRETTNDMMQLFYLDGKVYFWETVPVEDTLKYNLVTYRIQQDDFQMLTAEPVEYKMLKYDADENYIYWQDLYSLSLTYRTDYNFQNREITDMNGILAGNYWFDKAETPDENGNYGIVRVNLETGERTVICEDAYSFRVAGEDIYYIRIEKEADWNLIGYNGSSEDEDPIYDKYNGNVYVCDFDGNSRLLCHLEGEHIRMLSTTFYNPLVNEDYIGIPLHYWVVENNNITASGDGNLAIIDRETGEYKIVNLYE